MAHAPLPRHYPLPYLNYFKPPTLSNGLVHSDPPTKFFRINSKAIIGDKGALCDGPGIPHADLANWLRSGVQGHRLSQYFSFDELPTRIGMVR